MKDCEAGSRLRSVASAYNAGGFVAPESEHPCESFGGGTRDLQNFRFLFLLLIPLLLIFSTIPSNAADQENCMFCHQYPLLGTVDDNGTYNSYYVDEDHFMGSVHQALQCSECHSGITKVPHEKNLTVNCSAQCHMDEPAGGRKYSHKKIEDEIKNSAHGAEYGYLKAKGDPSDFPGCVSCHKNEENKVILSSRRNLEYVVMEESSGKCFDCHSDLNDFIAKNLVHVLRRTERVRSQKEIMDMCVSCHNDAELNKRHKMVNAIYSYLENYHGKTMELGLLNAPSCIDCHVKLGESPHAIKSASDPTSSTFAAVRGNTCVRADCHPKASTGMGKSYIHIVPTDRERFPIQFYLLAFFTLLTVASFVPLMGVLILELVRVMFPKFTLFKGRRKSDERD